MKCYADQGLPLPNSARYASEILPYEEEYLRRNKITGIPAYVAANLTAGANLGKRIKKQKPQLAAQEIAKILGGYPVPWNQIVEPGKTGPDRFDYLFGEGIPETTTLTRQEKQKKGKKVNLGEQEYKELETKFANLPRSSIRDILATKGQSPTQEMADDLKEKFASRGTTPEDMRDVLCLENKGLASLLNLSCSRSTPTSPYGSRSTSPTGSMFSTRSLSPSEDIPVKEEPKRRFGKKTKLKYQKKIPPVISTIPI